MVKSWIMVTGGAGYIGKHLVIKCLKQGYGCIIIDNLSTSKPFSCDQLRSLAGIIYSGTDDGNNHLLKHYQIDIRNYIELEKVFSNYQDRLKLIIHLAALKSIPDSLKYPELYYDVNVTGTHNLLTLAEKYKIHKFVFSSSAAVYTGPPSLDGYHESDAKDVNDLAHAYAKTKREGELILENMANLINKENKEGVIYISLRYFNPIGNISEGQIGENLDNEKTTSLMGQLGRTVLGLNKNKEFYLYGNDYPDTPDGTAMRDFIDVNDLAEAHLEIIERLTTSGYYCYNIGTGKPTSVATLLEVFKNYVKPFKVKTVARRIGDQPVCYANTTNVNNEIKWFSKTSLESSCYTFANRCNYFNNLSK